MDVVVDASVAVEAVSGASVLATRCQRILAENCFVPELIYSEVAQTLRRLERAWDQPQEKNLQRVMALPWTAVSFRNFGDRVWAIRHDVSLYDSTYVALSQVLDAPLATTDRKLASVARRYCDVLVPTAS